jgi:hypothetical protein
MTAVTYQPVQILPRTSFGASFPDNMSPFFLRLSLRTRCCNNPESMHIFCVCEVNLLIQYTKIEIQYHTVK